MQALSGMFRPMDHPVWLYMFIHPLYTATCFCFLILQLHGTPCYVWDEAFMLPWQGYPFMGFRYSSWHYYDWLFQYPFLHGGFLVYWINLTCIWYCVFAFFVLTITR